MWYARPMRVDTEALARVKSILAESLRESEEPGRFKQEPTPLRSWDVDCPWCGAIGLLIVKAHPHWPQAFDGGFSCAKCHKTAMRNGQARDADAYGSALMGVLRDEAHVGFRQQIDIFKIRDADMSLLSGNKVMPARPYPGLASLVRDAFGGLDATGSIKPELREETCVIGNETLPLSTELRADVHQFYQESMTHAKESGHLAYALDQAP